MFFGGGAASLVEVVVKNERARDSNHVIDNDQQK